jgi:hypothetical protein
MAVTQDYGSLDGTSRNLVELFWKPLEEANPGIDTINLTEAQASASKECLRTKPDGTQRRRASDCAHEHACIRCNLCQIDPSQAGRLDEIRDNLRGQVDEAQRNQWLGDRQSVTANHRASGSGGREAINFLQLQP